MKMKTNGEFGIGTLNPSAKLDVNGEIKAVGKLLISPYTSGTYTNDCILNFLDTNFAISKVFSNMYFRVNGSDKMVILSSGNIGIGTNNHSAKLNVNGNIHASDAAIGSISDQANYGVFAPNNCMSGSNYAIAQHSNGTTLINSAPEKYIHFRCGNADKMIMKPTGEFGIGTTNPQDKLEVHGNIRLYGGGNTGIIKMHSDAIQIGKLDINNSIKIRTEEQNTKV